MDRPYDSIANLTSWAMGVLGTLTLGWIGMTNRKVQRHEVEIAVLITNYAHIKEGIEEIKEHLGVPRKEK